MNYVLKGWCKFEFDGHGEQLFEAGDAWLQPPAPPAPAIQTAGPYPAPRLQKPRLSPMNNSFNRPFPNHVAIIMDGNGRWATQRGRPRMLGHRRGVELRQCVVIKVRTKFDVRQVTTLPFADVF